METSIGAEPHRRLLPPSRHNEEPDALKAQVRFGERSGETSGALGEPKLVTAKAARRGSYSTGLGLFQRFAKCCFRWNSGDSLKNNE